MSSAPPTIFDPARRVARYARVAGLQRREDAARYVIDDMIDEVTERLAFVRRPAGTAAVVGDWTGALATALERAGHAVTRFGPATLDEERPWPVSGFDLLVSIGTLDTVNDLPGALVHMRQALAPGGLAIASMVGGASLRNLRSAMQDADGDRPAARMHPLVDPRSAPGLLQRAGWTNPVVDMQRLIVRYSSLDRLVADLRAQGLGGVLASPAPPLTRDGRERARAAFLARADDDGKVSETFEIVTLTGGR
ncbi:methyltransferase domain-containing protein [Erythrobacter arachoides]|uniref:Methyltransferase domain-containing protein n=1 Tax=Aurantiacibacter arachoides TaxID=1850444 RepID=A0A844ZYC6_9SPHN|nr:methyltransferase domain-containing protein [Aurantiacibacter arachoides]MXO93153.1 methyltransferase domain-containing protein [Aurantiacibacter arachoides]GGD51638.1 methyltransferase [Aurantiacibacter arachoides]